MEWRTPSPRTEHFICDASGLRLAHLVDGGTELYFTPAILVLPQDSREQAEGVSEGTLSFDTDTGLRTLPYSHAWRSHAVTPTEDLGLEAVFSQTESALVVHDGDEGYTWQTTTVWAYSLGLLVPLSRAQVHEGPAGVTTQQEQATELRW